MTTTKCDICGKSPKGGEKMAYFRSPDFLAHDICAACAKKHCGKLLQRMKKNRKP